MNLAIKNATIYTITKGIIRKGTVLISHGKIKKVGQEITIPADYQVFNGNGKYLFPGFIDAHCHVGIFGEGTGEPGEDGNEMTNPITPAVRALDGINPHDPGFSDAREYGITTICILPGSGNVIGGMGIVLKTTGTVIDEMLVENSKPGLKAAFGENPKRVYGSQTKTPMTRMGTAWLMREAWIKALNYKRKLELGAKDPEKMPERDLGMEILLDVLEGRQTLRCHAHSAYDIVTAVRIAKEFGYSLTIEHTTEGHLITDFLVKSGIMCQVGPSATSRTKVELREKSFTTVSTLDKAGVHVSISTDAPVIPIEYLPNCAGWAMRDGLSEESALACITIRPAKVLGIDKRVGSIEEGKDADLGLWDAMPYDASARCHLTLIGGNVVYEKPKKK